MIHYIQPFSIEKNIGKAINDAVNALHPNLTDWVVLLDHDVMFLLPDSKKQLEENLVKTSLDILGPMTNRLAMDHQLVKNAFDEKDITLHINQATFMQENDYGVINPTRENLAAFCLCFKVNVWFKLGGFEEKTINFDSVFCIKARFAGFKLGIMRGIYVFHLYRMGQEGEARNNYYHLLPDK